MKHQETAHILEHRPLGGGYHVLRLRAPGIARDALAGQFLLLATRVAEERLVDPLLLRPFSFLGRQPESGTVDIFYRVTGRGTGLLSALPVGADLNAIGPLGRPWPDAETPRAALIAGGVGMPPLLDLAGELSRGGREVHVFYGGRGREHLHLLERFEVPGVQLHLATDDGSVGRRGTNVEDFASFHDASPAPTTLYACGPEGMLRAAAHAARDRSIPAWVSLEAPMACGIGVCRGCAVPHAEGGYRMVCSDGPVFRAEEVYA